ncbi:tetratricopeptide repeat protein [Streptomyces sp. ME08-AFT2]|uniref:ATP-binding protein n=1 Tax=Streptomyces sp. ME08-AFT2 TaxID=3028683 RepID=UPI0029B12CCA|nr:tetratricopeptide repeat protein [Streptomyces sp. ME08-AFT2]MDX3310008.1 tetratricopeptide repeat protein [Streptomyces sp. ME08-AFT2]
MANEVPGPSGPDGDALSQRLAVELTRAVVRAEKKLGRTLDRRELARRLNVSTSSLYAYLNGTTLPGSGVFDALLAALGVPGPEAGRLATLRDDADAARRLRPASARTRIRRSAAALSAPRQLPLSHPAFVGRDAELARLDTLGSLSENPTSGSAAVAAVAVVEGTAGVGKTALALHWAHRSRHRFPDGQLYVDLRGFGDDAVMNPAEALQGFLQALGVTPAAVPADSAVASGLLRTLLAGRRVLLVLDNARSADQVRPLLPTGSGSVAVVTSRNRLDGLVVREGALRIALDVLPRYAARTLLERQTGADRLALEPREVDELVDLCARLPLALSVAAARTAAGPVGSVGAMVRELRHARKPLDLFGVQDTDVDLRTVFHGSYALLPAPAARLFRLLACHPGPEIDATACAGLIGAAGPPTALLDTLTATHLVRQHTVGRFALHDLLRLYAAELLDDGPPQERRDGTERLLRHYLDTARLADHHLEPWRPTTGEPPRPGAAAQPSIGDRATATDWFESELSSLQAVIAHAAATPGLEPYAWRLADACAVHLRRSGRRAQRAAVHALAREAAGRAEDRAAHATATRRLADALSRLGRTDEVLELLHEALRTCRGLDDAEGVREVRLSLVRVHASRGAPRRALPHARLALAMAERTEEPLAVADGLTAVAQQWERLGEHTVALGHARRALDLYTRHGHLDGQAGILIGMGLAEQGLGRPAAAVGHYERSLDLDRALGDRFREAHALEHLGDAHGALGRREEALALWEEALALFEDLHHPDAGPVRAKLRTPATDHTAEDNPAKDCPAADYPAAPASSQLSP